MLSSLMYVSLRNTKCAEQEIDNILAACQRNNGDLEITGVLLYSNTQFIQYLEGEYENIFELYQKIKTDKRHTNVILVSASPIPKRNFPSWQMGSKQFSNNLIDFKTTLDEAEKELFQSVLEGNKQTDNDAFELIQKIFR